MVTTTRRMSWPAVAGATSYVVVADDLTVDTVTASPYTYAAEENSGHDLQVGGLNGGGAGPLSAKTHTVMPNATPPAVTNMQVGDLARGSLTVTFDYTPPADFASYVVTASSGTATVNAGTRTVTVTGAADSTLVTVTVSARDTGGATSAAATVKVTTPAVPDAGVPGVPPSFGVTHVGYSSITWAWNSVADATRYEVSTNSGTSWVSVGLAQSYGRTGLAESSTYPLYVRAVNAAGPSASVGKSATTLPKVKSQAPVYATRLYGYQQANGWGPVGLSHYASGVSGATDNWANQSNTVSWLYAIDNNLQSGPYSPQPYRWVTLAMTLNTDGLNAVYGVWGYQGTFQWDAWDTSGVLVQTGRTTGGGTSALLGVGPNVKNTLTGRRIARVRLYFYGWGASPGWYKLSEWALNARVITGYTYTYNPA